MISFKNTQKYHALPLNAIKPDGWLADQMQVISNIAKNVSQRSKLINNGIWTGEEHFPILVKGLLLLSAAMDDDKLSIITDKLISPIIRSANAGGDIGDKEQGLSTSKIEAVKAVYICFKLTNSKTALNFLHNFFKNMYVTYCLSPRWYNERARLIELIPAIQEVKKYYQQDWLKALADNLIADTNDWLKMADKYPNKKSWDRIISLSAVQKLQKQVEDINEAGKLKTLSYDEANSEWKKSNHQVYTELNAINAVKAVKYPVILSKYYENPSLCNKGLNYLGAMLKYHGNALGTINSSDMLSGTGIKDISVEVACELIESLSYLVQATFNPICCDLLEQIIFNLIPSVIDTETLCVQEITKLNKLNTPIPYSTAITPATMSLLSAYPIYLHNTVFMGDDEIYFASYAPSTINAYFNGAPFVIKVDTAYPFRNTVTFKVVEAFDSVELKLNFRAPKGATLQLITGGKIVASSNKLISVRSVLKKGSTFMLKMDIPLIVGNNEDDSISLYKGNLLLSEKIPTERKLVDGNTAVAYTPEAEWRYAPIISSKQLSRKAKGLVYKGQTYINDIQKDPFSFEYPPFEIVIKSKLFSRKKSRKTIPDSKAKIIYDKIPVEKTYIPYACAKSSLACFPKCLK